MSRSALLLVGRRRGRACLVLRHELVELFLVLGVTQTVEEVLELDLLLLEPLQCLGAVLVKGAVAARGRTEAKAETVALHAAAHTVHLVLYPLHLVLPAILVAPARHSSAPECEKEKGKSDRPPDDEAEDGHGDPAGMPGRLEHMRGSIGFFRGAAPSIDICGVGHFPLHDGDHAVVNVNNIYIPKPSRIFVKRAARRTRKKLFGGAPGAGWRYRRRPRWGWFRPAVGREAEAAQIDQHFGFQQIL